MVLSTPGLLTRDGSDPTQGSVANGGSTFNTALHAGERPGVVATTGPPSVAVLLMSRLRSAQVPWAVWRLARGAAGLGPVRGMRFARVLGSGREGGFGLKPGLDCQGVFAGFDDIDAVLSHDKRLAIARGYAGTAGFATPKTG